MAEYQAKSDNSLSFDLTLNEQFIGKLSYKSWFEFNALIEITNDGNYQVIPKGFWGTTIEIKDHETVLLKFAMNWSGEIIIQTYFRDIEKDYALKHKGFFKESFILEDQEGAELLVIKPQLKWNKMRYEYQITTSATFELFSDKELLLMTVLHCANYYISITASAIGA